MIHSIQIDPQKLQHQRQRWITHFGPKEIMEPNKCNNTHHDLLAELETKCLHRYRPLAISTKVQNPHFTKARTWIHTNLGLHKKSQRFCEIEAKGWSGWTLEVALEEASEESEILGLEGATTASPSSSVVGVWDLRFRRTKKPARVADKNTRMNLRGHILLSEQERRMWLRNTRVCAAHSWTQETKEINIYYVVLIY